MRKSKSRLTALMAGLLAFVSLLALTVYGKGTHILHGIMEEEELLLEKDAQGDGVDRPWCGTYPWRTYEELYKSRQVEMLTAGKTFLPTLNQDTNDVAVLVDDGTILLDPNPFDLGGKSIRFTPAAGAAYNVTDPGFSFDTDLGTILMLDDDDTRQIDLGFNFSFYGVGYNNVFVNSDGNLTFGVGDSASDTLRDLEQFLFGPPRIAGFLSDLNPADPGTPMDGGVFSKVSSDRAVFTWNKVPLFRFPGRPLLSNTFQIVLFSNGEIEIRLMSIQAPVGVTGISPGRTTQLSRAVKFSRDLPLQNLQGAIGEAFNPNSLFSFIGLTKKFYSTHGDLFDFLVVFTQGIPPLGGPGAFAFALNINNNVRGIGYQHRSFPDGTLIYPNQIFDFSGELGSTGRLQTLVFMNPLSQYPDDPTRTFLGTNNTLQVLGQETGHRWGTFVFFNDNGTPSPELLGRDQAHWSFFFDTNASVMEGNQIRDNGGGSFVTADATQRYSPLDQYLMGLRPKEEVAPFFFVANPNPPRDCRLSLSFPGPRDCPPRIGFSFMGTRRDVTIDDIVAVERDRVPNSSESMHTLAGAFILLLPRGMEPSQADIDKMTRIRTGWEQFFSQATENRGRYITSLVGIPPEGNPTTINFPFYKQNGFELTGIAITNRSQTLPVNLTLTAYNNNGQRIDLPQMQNARTISILPRQQVARQGNELFGLSNSISNDGWIQATLSNNEVSSFFVSSGPNALDGAVASSDTSRGLVFTRVVDGALFNQNVTTEIYIVNPSATDSASGQMVLFGINGTPLGSPVPFNIPPHGRLAGNLRTLFPGVSFPQVGGHIEVNSTQPLAGFELTRYGNRDISSLSAQTVGTSNRLYSAHFASGGAGVSPAPFFTELNLVNTTTSVINATITLIGNDGQVIGNPIQRPINAKAALNGTLSTLFGFPNPSSDPNLKVGSIRIEASGPGLVGDVLFGDPNNALVMSNLPLANNLLTEAVFSQVAQGLGLFTGLAVLNPNDAQVQLTISVVNHQGLEVGSTTVAMAPRSRFSNLLFELVSQSANQVGGYIRLRAQGGGVAAFEIFGDTGLSRFNAAVPPQVVSLAP